MIDLAHTGKLTITGGSVIGITISSVALVIVLLIVVLLCVGILIRYYIRHTKKKETMPTCKYNGLILMTNIYLSLYSCRYK